MAKKIISSNPLATPPAPPSVGGLTPMPLATPQDFINYWDKQIKEWAGRDGKITPDEDYWNENIIVKGETKILSEHIGFNTDLIPEPYYGDPYNCSIVILNFNPGNPKHPCTQCIRNASNSGTQCGKLVGKYSQEALKFPILGKYNQNNPFHVTEGRLCYDGRPWWLKREEWLNKIISNAGVTKNSRPFALELCAWHSKTWGGVKYTTKLLQSLKDRLAGVIEESIKNSALGIGICVGSQYGKILPEFGYDELPEGKLKSYGVSLPEITEEFRNYRVFYNRNGVYIINTWLSEGYHKMKVPANNDYVNALISVINKIKKTGTNGTTSTGTNGTTGATGHTGTTRTGTTGTGTTCTPETKDN